MLINLKKNSGFDLMYKDEELVSNDFTFSRIKEVTIDDMKAQLVNDEVSLPDLFYKKYMKADHDGILKKKKLRLNFYTIFSGVAGIEYIKTYSKSIKRYPRVIEVEAGSGLLMIQKDINREDIDIILSRVRSGDKAIIPCGYSCAFVNNKQSPLIVAEIMNSKAILRKTLDDIGGLSYYVISKNSRSEIVKNPNYKSADVVRKVNWSKFCTKYNISPKTPVLKQILRKYEKYNWLFKENSITSV